jgi:hypothetical protein
MPVAEFLDGVGVESGGTYGRNRACKIHSSYEVQSGKKSSRVNTELRGQKCVSRVVVRKSVALLQCCKTVNL